MVKKYVVHHKKEPYDVYIGRPGIWGNPFHITQFRTREQSIEQYTEWLMNQPHLLKKIHTLKGKVLGCYCDPLPCHGHILAALANEDYEYNDKGSV